MGKLEGTWSNTLSIMWCTKPSCSLIYCNHIDTRNIEFFYKAYREVYNNKFYGTHLVEIHGKEGRAIYTYVYPIKKNMAPTKKIKIRF